MPKQNLANHHRFVPMYHYVLTLLVLIALVGSLINVYRAWGRGSGRIEAVVVLLLVAIALIEGYYLRVFPLKAQDRVIRAEENFRHYLLHGEPLDPELDIRQIIGLRFAGDEELGPLAQRAVKEKLSENDIKKAIENWRGDHYRA